MLLAQVIPSPAPPLLYQAVDQPPFKSEYSVCHTLRLVFTAPEIRDVYSWVVMKPREFIVPEDFS